jgi:4-amino-4-deoxy-L-arabinose transferase-like glycosyltransferase
LARLRAWLSTEWIQVLLITSMAAAMRVIGLGHLPPGLYHDEAYNGLDALQVLQGWFPLFFEANNGREPLFIYLVAVAVRTLGRTPVAIRSVAALLGILTVPATYAMAREWMGRKVGLLAAFITATTFWHLNLSRIGFRAVGLPLFLGLWLWQCGLGLHRRHRHHWIWAGILLGLGLYTYIAARFVPVALVLWIAYWVWRRQTIPWTGLLYMGVATVLVSSPLLVYAYQHLAIFLSRSAQVSVFAPEINRGDLWGALAHNILGTLGMFNGRGDFIPRHNLPNRPVFDPLMGIAFLLGLWLCLRACRRNQESALLVSVSLTMLLPTVLAEGAPHMLRAVGVLPVLFVFPAVGLNALADRVRSRWSRRWAAVLVASVLCVSLTTTFYDYFVRHVRSQDTYYNFESGVSELATDVNQFLDTDRPSSSSDRKVLLDQRLWHDWTSLRFLVPESSNLVLVDENTTQSDVSVDVVVLVVWPYADFDPYLALLPRDHMISVRNGPMERGDLDKEARRLCLVYETTPAPQVPSTPIASFESGIALWSAEVTRGEGSVKVRLLWRASQPLSADYTVFVHLRAGDQPLAQSDSYPAQAHYRTSLWRPGDIVVDEHMLTGALPDDRPLILDVGLYSLQTMVRLKTLDATGTVTGDQVTIPGP